MVIALDMDEVFADTVQGLLNWYNREHGTQIQPLDIWGKSIEELKGQLDVDKLQSYLFLPGFFRQIPIMDGAKEVLPALVDKHDVYIVTAAQEFPYSLREKYDWLDEYFPCIHWSKRVFCGDKSFMRADVMIDDNAYNLESFHGKPYIFTAFHNTAEGRYERINNWEEMAQLFL